MPDRFRAGGALASVVLLLLVLAGVGAWNYHRNLQIELQTEGPRPYENYAQMDLKALRSAYAADLEGVRAQLVHAKQQRARVSRNLDSISTNVLQFAQTTRTSTAIRDAAAAVAERASQIAELDKELEIRARFGKGMARHLKRLTTI
ncbi:MAG: hypothetical protein V3T64_10365 [Myxococcota bacterium]